jgi:Rod binding domain-containing protein
MAEPLAGLAGDARSLQALRSDAARDPKVAAKEAAKQFEALFMQELMKSMRAAQVGTALFDNDASRMGTEMLDAQMATSFAGRPGGLSDMIAKQLERQMGLQPGPIPKPDVKLLVMPPTAAESERASRGPRILTRGAGLCSARASGRGCRAASRPGQISPSSAVWPSRLASSSSASCATPTAHRRTTCSASRPAPDGRARWPR